MPMSDGENVALTPLMSFTGTATELDDQLPNAIASFVASHLELKNTLARATEEMDAAAKAAQEEARNKGKSTTSLPRNRQGRATPLRRKNKRRSWNHPGRPVSSITLLRLNRRPSPQGLRL
jgi:PRTRC genetic system protein E